MMVLMRQALTLALLAICAAPASVAAAPYVARGEAELGQGKAASPVAARRAALLRARRSALETALAEVSAPVDQDARKAVFGALEAWTGAYRVLSESTRGGLVAVEVEVEIDAHRLAKRVARRQARPTTPMFVRGDVEIEGECGHAPAQYVVEELAAMGALARGGAGDTLDLRVRCRPLGLVRHTFVHAARVELEAVSSDVPVARAISHGFARDDLGAVSGALQRAIGDLAPKLGAHRHGELVVRVRSPLPSARIRRLERAMRESVLGVEDVQVGGLEPDGSVVLRVAGELRSDTLARELEALSLPGFSLTIARIDGPDALTIRLSD